MSDEVTESAKAIQEVAKTTGQAISTIEKIGDFFSKIMKESIAATCGMLADTLKYKRWKRQISLIEKADRLITDKKLSDKMRPISPKLALPIFQYASLEEDESLHDAWANLLVTALNPSCQIPRSSFIDIIRQLEPIDVKIVNLLYNYHSKKSEEAKEKGEKDKKIMMDIRLRTVFGDNYDKKRMKKDDAIRLNKILDSDRNRIIPSVFPLAFPLSQTFIMKELNIDNYTYWTSIDNLIRERLIASYIKKGSIEAEVDAELREYTLTYDYGYLQVSITALGISFVKACTIID